MVDKKGLLSTTQIFFIILLVLSLVVLLLVSQSLFTNFQEKSDVNIPTSPDELFSDVGFSLISANTHRTLDLIEEVIS